MDIDTKITRKNKPDNPKAKGNSRYAKKKSYLTKTNQWGFDVSEPKPWK